MKTHLTLTAYLVIMVLSSNAIGAVVFNTHDTQPISSGIDNFCGEILQKLTSEEGMLVLEDCVYSISEHLNNDYSDQELQNPDNLKKSLDLAETNFLLKQQSSVLDSQQWSKIKTSLSNWRTASNQAI